MDNGNSGSGGGVGLRDVVIGVGSGRHLGQGDPATAVAGNVAVGNADAAAETVSQRGCCTVFCDAFCNCYQRVSRCLEALAGTL